MLILPFDSVDFGDTPMIRPIQIWVRIPSSSFPSLVCMWPSPKSLSQTILKYRQPELCPCFSVGGE